MRNDPLLRQTAAARLIDDVSADINAEDLDQLDRSINSSAFGLQQPLTPNGGLGGAMPSLNNRF